MVNNKTVIELGTKVDPEKDEVKYLGKIVHPQNSEHIYILLNKPIRLCNNYNRSI